MTKSAPIKEIKALAGEPAMVTLVAAAGIISNELVAFAETLLLKVIGKVSAVEYKASVNEKVTGPLRQEVL